MADVEIDNRPIPFTEFFMQYLWQPGTNKQHVFEETLIQLWSAPGCVHIFELEHDDELGWTLMTPAAPPMWWAALMTAVDNAREEEIAELLNTDRQHDDNG